MTFAFSRKQWFGLMVALVVAAQVCYFRVPFIANDYGAYKAEWPLMVDMLLTVPLLYYLVFRPPLKKLLLAWLSIAAGGVMLGRVLIPEEHKQLWRVLQDYSLLTMVLGVALELLLLAWLLHQLSASLRASSHADDAIETVVRGRFGQGAMAALMVFEIRIWYYGLFMRRGERLRFRGEQHFSYDKNDGNASNQFAFIMVLLFEMPLVHLLVHLMSLPAWLAWGLDFLNLWGLLYLVAEYRASLWRPVSLDRDALLIRNGVLAGDRVVAYGMVASVARCADGVRRQRGILRFRQSGRLNVEIRLRQGSTLAGAFGGVRPVSAIYLSLDRPDVFIDALRQRL